jgi:hypothetical protein
VSLSRKQHDSSMFDTFIRGEICSFKAGNRWKSLGAKAGLYGGWSDISQLKFSGSSKSAVPCAVMHCDEEESHHH